METESMAQRRKYKQWLRQKRRENIIEAVCAILSVPLFYFLIKLWDKDNEIPLYSNRINRRRSCGFRQARIYPLGNQAADPQARSGLSLPLLRTDMGEYPV